MPDQPIIFFDGVCNLCNGAVNFVIKRDKKSLIKFATLQSEFARQYLAKYNLPENEIKSFVFIENNTIAIRSTAALKVSRYLKSPWPLMYNLIIVPKFIRDGIYGWISKNRYKWFGKKAECMIPSPGIKSRFLNEII